VEGTIEDRAAELTFHISFRNPASARLEGVLIMPIPADTALSGFSMSSGGKTMKGELLEAEKAGAIYQAIVSRLRDPGLLELVGERLIRARVFPIEPNGTVTVRMTLTQILPKSGELFSLRIPMSSARMLQGEKGRASARILLSASSPIRSLYSPSPEAVLKRIDERRAEISYEEKSGGTGDLSLFYSLRSDPLAAGLLAFREEGEKGFFMLSLSPRPRAQERDILPKDLVFIVDRSGSMEEAGKLGQAKRALSFCLGRLSPQDRFGIVDFATDSSSFEGRLLPASEENKARALRYVERLEAAGGTNIGAALEEGLGLLSPSPDRLAMAFFLTDGLPTAGETDVGTILKKAARANEDPHARLFTFGVGSDVNTLLLDKLSQSHGAREYVGPGEDLENKVSSLYQKLSRPALTDLRISWKGLEAEEVFPRVRDLFYGSELLLLGRYRGAGKGTLIVTGKAGTREERFEFPVELPERAEHDFLPRLWANLKVGHELDAIRLSGRADPEVVREIVRLAKRFGIVTPYTSYLVTEEGANLEAASRAALRGMELMAADATSSGFSGGPAMARAAQKASSFLGRASALSLSASGTSPSPMAALREAEDEARAELGARGLAAARTRAVAGKTFYLRSGTWVDGESELEEGKHPRVKISYLGPEYFELLRRHPGLGRVLALGQNLTLLHQGTVYQIVAPRN